MAETTMLRQYADKLEAATDALNLATAAVDKAKREKAYWQRRIAEETGYGDRYDYRGEVPAIDRTAQFR
jgi:hypothetical protein